MTEPAYDHRLDLIGQAVETLNRYTPFKSGYRVSFSLGDLDDRGLPTIAGKIERSDGVPIAQSDTDLDRKLAKLKDQTAVIRPFFLAKCNSPWNEEEVNPFTQVDFDYAAILGYTLDETGHAQLASFFYPSTDALLFRQKPKEDGAWHIPVATFSANQLSLDPRKKFARFLYLAERMSEALEYQIDKIGYFYSNPNP